MNDDTRKEQYKNNFSWGKGLPYYIEKLAFSVLIKNT